MKNSRGLRGSWLLIVLMLLTLPASAQSASRKTALRAFELCKSALGRGDWEDAKEKALTGLSYDQGISDLWYCLAVAQKNTGSTLAEALESVSAAINTASWVDYNRDGARILYADILADTGGSAEALALLAEDPPVYGADADFIRAKAFHRAGDVPRARETIAQAHRIYPADTRFLRFFFEAEFSPGYDTTPEVRSLARLYARSAVESSDPELVILGAAYSEGDARIRALQSFNARGFKHPLFALFALDDGLITQDEAFAYFASFAEAAAERSFLETFASRLTEENAVESLSEMLDAYSGRITADTTGDRIPNLFVDYERGRPAFIRFDENQDGVPEWEADCDFGAPVTVRLGTEGLRVDYGRYPSVLRAEIPGAAFVLPPESLLWSPVEILYSPALLASPGKYRFFLPAPRDGESFPERALFEAASRIETSGPEGGEIVFFQERGKPVTADRFREGRLFSRTFFRDGLALSRSIDEDGDGVFETSQVLSFSEEESSRYQTPEEEARLYGELFGAIPAAKGLYVARTQTDTDKDTIIDFIVEYTGGGGKNSWWDIDGDGGWELAWIRYPDSETEDTLFRLKGGDEPVVVRSEKGAPVRVSRNGVSLDITLDSGYGFYWVGAPATEEDALLVDEALKEEEGAGYRVKVVDGVTAKILAVKVGPYRFGEILDEYE